MLVALGLQQKLNQLRYIKVNDGGYVDQLDQVDPTLFVFYRHNERLVPAEGSGQLCLRHALVQASLLDGRADELVTGGVECVWHPVPIIRFSDYLKIRYCWIFLAGMGTGDGSPSSSWCGCVRGGACWLVLADQAEVPNEHDAVRDVRCTCLVVGWRSSWPHHDRSAYRCTTRIFPKAKVPNSTPVAGVWG